MKALLLAGATLAAVACSSEPTAVVVREHKVESDPSPLHPLIVADEATTTSTTTAPTTTTTVAPTTTTTEPPAVAAAPRRSTTSTAYEIYEPPAPQGQTTGRGSQPAGNDAPLACIRSYEGDYATNTGNGYYGAYQFDLPTWRSVGGSGLPSDASPAEQDMRAQMLYDRRGLAPWPTPNRMCG